jgi:hypothetical protein
VSRRRLLAVAAVVLAAVLVLTRCVPQDTDAQTYREQARLTLGTALSEVATVRLVLQTAQRGDILAPYAEMTVRHSEDNLGTTIDAFSSLRPPAALDGLAASTSDLLSRADDLVVAARVCVERSTGAGCPGLGGDLGQVATRLDQAEGRLP